MIVEMVFFALFWLACGVIDYGLIFAYFQREYPSLAEEDYCKHIFNALLGIPFGLAALLSSCTLGYYKHGFKWR